MSFSYLIGENGQVCILIYNRVAGACDLKLNHTIAM
uniref:Uncharacterized protein n=1 Tax=Anguilla anguilla TaxID=7936 RepID=A0A0E9UCV4_ANGAN